MLCRIRPYSMTNGLHKLSSQSLIKAFHGYLIVHFDRQNLSRTPLSGFIIMDMNMVPRLSLVPQKEIFKGNLINSPFNES